jgi:hypothetical protein
VFEVVRHIGHSALRILDHGQRQLWVAASPFEEACPCD